MYGESIQAPNGERQSTQVAPAAPTGSSLHMIVRRLSNCIEEETDQVQKDTAYDFRASSERKSRLLYELNRASRTVDFRTLDAHCLAELRRLKKALAVNREQIQAHLTAVRDVSRIMVDFIRNEEADGTYGENY